MFHFGSANRPGPTISAANRPGPTFGAANRPGPMVEGAGPMGGGAGIGGTSGSVVSPFGSTFGMKPPFAFGSSGAPDPAGLRQGTAGQGDLIGPAPTGPDRRKSLPPNPLPKGIVPSSNVNRSLPVNRLPPETSKSVAAAVALSQVSPPSNAIRLQGRPITTAEIRAAQAFFDEQFRQLTDQLVEQFKEQFLDPAKLVTELNVKGIDPDSQLRISQAIEQGDASQVQILWAIATKDVARAESLRRQVAIQEMVTKLRDKAAAGSLSIDDLQSARRILASLDLPEHKGLAATGTLDALDNYLEVREAISNAVPGQATTRVDLPHGPVPVIWNPRLPAQTAVSLGNGTVMVGTGGVGHLQQSMASVVEAMGLPLGTGQSVAPSSEPPTLAGVLLVNPEITQTPVSFRIQQASLTLLPGKTMHLPAGTAWTIEFARGRQLGTQRYGLAPGTYHFAIGPKGWELYRQTFEVVVDNTDSPREFQYLVQNEPVTVAARQTRTHVSNYPIVVQYDRGDGRSIKQVKLEQGTVKVAIHPGDGLWDLFSPQSTQAADFVPSF